MKFYLYDKIIESSISFNLEQVKILFLREFKKRVDRVVENLKKNFLILDGNN